MPSAKTKGDVKYPYRRRWSCRLRYRMQSFVPKRVYNAKNLYFNALQSKKGSINAVLHACQ